jgi:hypothetical protein
MAYPINTTYDNTYDTPLIGAGYSGVYIPEIWSGKLVEKFYAATVFGEIANTDYEGEISAMGDSVQIRTVPDITITNYEIGDTLTYQQPGSNNVNLLIDQGKYFAFRIDDVESHQTDLGLMNDWADDASQQMKIAVDTDLLSDTGKGLLTDVPAANQGATAGVISSSIPLGTGTTPIALTAANILTSIVGLGTVLDEQNVPESGRWLILDAKAVGLIKLSDLKDASLAGDGNSILRNGRVGMIDRFTIFLSNNVPRLVGAGNATIGYAGHKSGVTFASQFVNMETLRAESTFGDLMRGLNVFGYETIKPESVAALHYTA